MSDTRIPATPEAAPSANAVTEPLEETIWEEKVSLLDRIPRAISMAFVFAVFIGLLHGATSLGLVSPIILPPPA